MVIGNDKLAGFALGFLEPWHDGYHFYLKEMCIHADFQRQGIGTQLMKSLTEFLKRSNTKKMYLLTARGDLSESFYEKMGFYTSPKMIMMAQHIE